MPELLITEDYMSVRVHIAETAFISILVTAIESFPSKYVGKRKLSKSLPEGEVYGLLFGQRINKKDDVIYHATIAIPMQMLLEKKEDQVSPSVRHLERIKSVIEAYPMYQFLGTFHSHPSQKQDYYGVKSSVFSDTDEERALDDAAALGEEIIEVIIGVTSLNKKVKKEPDIRWSSIQNYCGNFKYSLSAYITDADEKRLREVDNLICPFAAGVGNYDLISQ